MKVLNEVMGVWGTLMANRIVCSPFDVCPLETLQLLCRSAMSFLLLTLFAVFCVLHHLYRRKLHLVLCFYSISCFGSSAMAEASRQWKHK